MDLIQRFAACLRALGDRGPAAPLGDELVAAWGAPGRHYHDLRHLRACLDRLDALRHLAERPAEVEMAIWFHDAIYDPRAPDSEERSARWAERALAPRVGDDVASRVAELVRATRHHGPVPEEADAQLLLDIDLAILGGSPEEFDAYEQSVRREYAWVDEGAWRAGRAAVLSGLLSRTSLFLTAPMRARFEERARDNLRRALARLSPGG